MYLWLKGGILYRTQNILPTQNILLIQNILLTQNIVLTQSIPLTQNIPFTQNILLTQNMTLIQNILLNQKPNMICAEEHIEKIIFKEEERNDSFGRKRRINWKRTLVWLRLVEHLVLHKQKDSLVKSF